MTNDDGIDSPALRPLLAELASLAPVVGLVPAREFSWTSKTMSRFARPRLEPQDEEDLPCPLFAMDGSPADCANVGVHWLHANPPSLVVSGVNVGSNAGLAFLLSSGTVGAAVEGMLSGVPALAFSLQLRPEDYTRWRAERNVEFLADMWGRAASVSRQITSQVLAAGLPEGAGVLSVNMPPDVETSTPRRLTRVTPTTYGAFFRPTEDGAFEHHYEGFRRVGKGPDGDIEALGRGEISMTPLRFDLNAPISTSDQVRFEQGI
ncbi:MAG: 5'/3'-nucleotidase SurE [Gemmatimonadetes bacterium]|nr:5'/3'-nucleotidase SurE [Gemmatimonadota bacterium]